MRIAMTPRAIPAQRGMLHLLQCSRTECTEVVKTEVSNASSETSSDINGTENIAQCESSSTRRNHKHVRVRTDRTRNRKRSHRVVILRRPTEPEYPETPA